MQKTKIVGLSMLAIAVAGGALTLPAAAQGLKTNPTTPSRTVTSGTESRLGAYGATSQMPVSSGTMSPVLAPGAERPAAAPPQAVPVASQMAAQTARPGGPAMTTSAALPAAGPRSPQRAAAAVPAPVPPRLTPAQHKQMAKDLAVIDAAFAGETSGVARALAAGGKVNAADWQYGFTPLIWASLGGHLGTVRYLLRKGAKVDVRSKEGVPLVLAMGEQAVTDTRPMGEYLAARWVQPYAGSPTGGITALMAAAARGYNLTVRELLRAKANPNAATSLLITPLDMAAFSGNVPAAQALLARGAKIDKLDITGVSPLQTAFAVGRTPMVQFLLKQGADPTMGGPARRQYIGAVAKYLGHPETAKIVERAARSWQRTHHAPKAAAGGGALPLPAGNDEVTILN